jgi:hypothetical protein
MAPRTRSLSAVTSVRNPSGCENGEFRKGLKVGGVEGIDSVHTIRLHCRDDLQMEHVAARDGMAPKQVQQPVNRVRRDRKHMQESE